MNRTLLRVELLGLTRDTRTILLSVVLPLILLPVLMLTFRYLNKKANLNNTDERFIYAIANDSNEASNLLSLALNKDSFTKSSVASQQKALDDGTIDLAVNLTLSKALDNDSILDLRKAYPEIRQIYGKESSMLPSLELVYRSDQPRSVRALIAAREQLSNYREQLVAAYFIKQKASPSWSIKSKDISSERERSSRHSGPALAIFLVISILGAGSIAAIDSLAGEKERGTLATLFLSSLSRREIIITKLCAVVITSAVITIIQALNLSLYLASGWFDFPTKAVLTGNILSMPALGAIFLCELLFLSSLLLWISARCNSFKEAQLFFFPAFLIAVALSLTGIVPTITSSSAICIVPIAGPSVLITEILAGKYSLLPLCAAILVHLTLAGLLTRSIIAHINKESFLTSGPSAIGYDLQLEHLSSRALPFYALLGALLMVVPSNFAQLSTLKGQVIFNQIFLFVVGPLLLLAFFGIKPVSVIKKLSISPSILICCLALIPLGQLAATGLSHLLNPVLPAPEKAMQQMAELLDIKGTPAWQLYLFIGIIPGICEEFAFRGVLLYSLHRRFSPWILAGVVAIIFGLFHMSFFRVLPTAFLGYFLGILVLATGSLLPSIIVHLGNNCFAVWAMLNSWNIDSLSGWTYSASFIGLIVLVALVRRLGRGYPGTSWSK